MHSTLRQVYSSNLQKLKRYMQAYQKFYHDLDHFVYPKPNRPTKLFLLFDGLSAFFIHGSTPSDYLDFEYWKKTHRERSNYITFRSFITLQKKYNDSHKISIFRNKNEFNKTFFKYLKRTWLDVSSCTLAEFKSFIANKTKIIVKPIDGYQGLGIYSLDLTDHNIEDEMLFENMQKENVVIEELITPGVLSEFNPSSINSIRVVTLLNNEKTNFIFAGFKMGNGDVLVDNFAYGGIVSIVDLDTGIIIAPGANKKREKFIRHPYSGKQIVGYQIPKWDEILNTVVEASKIVPEVRYVGWDVTINQAGEVLIIEGNDNSDYDIQGDDQIGRKNIFLG